MGSLNRLSRQANAHEDSIWALAWLTLPGESEPTLLTGGIGETPSVKSWRVEAGEGLRSVEEYTGEAVSVLGIVSVAASDAGLAATCSLDSTVRVWDLASNTHKAALESPPGEAWSLAFAPGAAGARHLACAGGAAASVTLFNLEAEAGAEREAVFSLPPEVVEADPAGAFVVSVAYSADGRRLACGSMGGCVAVFDVASQRLLHTLPGLSMAVRGLSWGGAEGGGSSLAAACDDGHVHVYNGESGQLLADCAGHKGAALCVSLSPSAAACVSGGADGSLRLWEARSGRCSQALAAEHGEAVWGVAHSPGGAHVASVSDDRSIGLFAVA